MCAENVVEKGQKIMPTPLPGAPTSITVTQEVYRDLIRIVERAEKVAHKDFTYSDAVQQLLAGVHSSPELLDEQGELMAGKV